LGILIEGRNTMPALACHCKDLEKDPSSVERLTVLCPECDPDNPLAVPQANCPTCGGSGQAMISLSAIVTEIKTSRLELLVGGKPRDEGFLDI
jgi:hypothetical protein